MNMRTQERHHWLQRAACAIIIAVAAMAGAHAQPKGERFSPEQFRAHLEGFISHEAGLTTSEAKVFFPLYHELQEKEHKLQDKIFRLKRKGPDNDASDKEYADAVEDIKELEVKKAQLEEQYFKKMCKVIPARKVYLVMKAEDKFHRKMLRDFKPKGKDRK